MTVSVFLSHNVNDKPFVRNLARDLENHGVKYWLDEAEIKGGDSLIVDRLVGWVDGRKPNKNPRDKSLPYYLKAFWYDYRCEHCRKNL